MHFREELGKVRKPIEGGGGEEGE